MNTLKIETDDIFNEEFNIQPNKRSKRKEDRYNDFWKFCDGQAGYVTKPTQNFELELKLMYLKSRFYQLQLQHYRKIGSIKIHLSAFVSIILASIIDTNTEIHMCISVNN